MSTNSSEQKAHRRNILYVGVGMIFLSLSGVLMTGHAHVIQEIQSVSLPTLSRLPQLEQRMDVLREQVETAQLHATVRVGSQEEQVHVYILPKEPNFDRLLAMFDILQDDLKRSGWLSQMSAIEVGEKMSIESGVNAHSVTVDMTIHEEGLRKVLSLLRLSGLLTVGDALTTLEQSMLLERTEAENPAGIVAVEQFLSTDLLEYVRDSRAHEDRLMRSFTSPTFENAVQSITSNSLLQDARSLMDGSMGHTFLTQRLWPLPFLSIDTIQQSPGAADGWHTVKLSFLLYSLADENPTEVAPKP